MTYNEAVEYLYNQTPQFQRIGAAAYKPGLDTAVRLSAQFGNPHRDYPTIHIAGTNGKGSTAHTIAAVLQSAGYKVGLYTSPHLIDFRERMRVNGEMIPKARFVSFVERYHKLRQTDSDLPSPSFFELTTVMAFEWFALEHVDVAVIEVGLGGRLDSTNIITPCLSVITNISFDHMAQLGDTLEAIAHEKAGIIKDGVDVVCGETKPAIRQVFADVASAHGSSIDFAQLSLADMALTDGDGVLEISGTPFGDLRYQLSGFCQHENCRTVIAALSVLKRKGWNITDEAVANGFANVCTLTGLMGRWMILNRSPKVVCDTGHNEGGWALLSKQLETLPRPLYMAIGFVNDKDISHILPYMPTDAHYVFTRASVPRALPAENLAAEAAKYNLHGVVTSSVEEAYRLALHELNSDATAHEVCGSLFVGGSTFVVADLWNYLRPQER
jgi:dihydrofolate synthase/folylpolyglutamate synthase